MASYSSKHIVFVVIRNIILILIAVALFQYPYKIISTKLSEKTALQAKYQNIYDDLEQFETLNENMSETKLKIEDVISSFPGEYVPNSMLLSDYKDRVFSVAEEYSIKVTTETVARDEETGMITLSIGFNAKYEPVYKFLFAIEMFSKVHSFSIDGNSNVSVVCSPILYNTEIDSFFSGRSEKMDDLRAAGYFKEIFKKSADTINSIGHIPSWRDIDPAPPDPFYEYIAPKVVKAVKPKIIVKRKPPKIEISGIIYDSTNPIVIIDGKLYRQGDFYKTVKIIAIQERTITVELDGQKYIVKFNKEE